MKDNCLGIINPDLAKEWHQTKNNDLTPFDVTMSLSSAIDKISKLICLLPLIAAIAL